jgi:hypothetical protein
MSQRSRGRRAYDNGYPRSSAPKGDADWLEGWDQAEEEEQDRQNALSDHEDHIKFLLSQIESVEDLVRYLADNEVI